ncbi:MAG TPA: diguanylate cyclase [Devosiaceae bacterium]|nr:diguanylate cyclase [Devosiaceae bacterium]
MSDGTMLDEQAIRVIVAATSRAERAALCEQLRRPGGMLVEEVGSWREVRDHLDELRYDVAVVSGAVGGISAIELNQNIKMFCKEPPATILLDMAGNMHAAIKAFHCGFADYLPREPGRDLGLRDAVVAAYRIISAERARTQRFRELERLAQQDSVTGLPNHHYLLERLDQLIGLGKRHGSAFGVMLIRVNRLDRIRSSFGGTVGDAVLYAFAKRLHTVSRRSAMHGRFADDCFLYLLEGDVTEESVVGACARLKEALAFSLELENVGLTVSASVAASIFPGAGNTVEALLEAAGAKLRQIPEALEEQGISGIGDDGSEPAKRAPSFRSAQPESIMVPTVPLDQKSPGTATRLSDRRNAVRRRCLKRGLLVLSNGFSTVNCVIRDLSEAGARVEVEGSFNPLEGFELRLVESGRQYKVEKRWQNGNRLGLKFLQQVR